MLGTADGWDTGRQGPKPPVHLQHLTAGQVLGQCWEQSPCRTYVVCVVYVHLPASTPFFSCIFLIWKVKNYISQTSWSLGKVLNANEIQPVKGSCPGPEAEGRQPRAQPTGLCGAHRRGDSRFSAAAGQRPVTCLGESGGRRVVTS